MHCCTLEEAEHAVKRLYPAGYMLKNPLFGSRVQGCNNATSFRSIDMKQVLIGPQGGNMEETNQNALEAIYQISNTIDSLRSSAGLSVNALATEAEMSTNTLKSILRKENCPSIASLIRLCNVFNLSLWRFFLIADGENQFGHQKSRDMLELFEPLPSKHKDLLIYIARELGK